MDGTVISATSIDMRQTVAASYQTPTLLLGARDLAKMQVHSSVSESRAGNVRVGQPVDL